MQTKKIAELFQLDGRVALVTGAARGIGKAVALTLAEAGADVVVADIEKDGAEAAASEVKKRGVKSLAAGVDVSRSEEIETMAQAAQEAFGQVDILINNAAILTHLGVLVTDQEIWERTFSVNLTGAYLCAKAIAPGMVERGWGKIVNIGSSLSSRASVANMIGGGADYCASKAAIQGLTRALAWELGSSSINVNAVAPGTTRTPMHGDYIEAAEEYMKPTIPLGRLAEPEEIAHAVLFLVSEAARYITGQTIHVNGGQIMVD